MNESEADIINNNVRNLLEESGWKVSNIPNLAEYSGVALQEFKVNSGKRADFVLFIKDKAIGVIEVKRLILSKKLRLSIQSS